MRNKISMENALLRMQALCSRGEHCEHDIRLKLRAMQMPQPQTELIVRSLRDEQFIDDSRYARAFVRDKYRFNGWGRAKISSTLRAKGIGTDVIDEALDEIDAEEYHDVMIRALESKARSLSSREPRAARNALVRFATSRGYEPAKFFPAISSLLSGADDEDVSDYSDDDFTP